MLDQLQSVFASFQKNEVKYVVIGGVAAVLYGVPRATFDLDVLAKEITIFTDRSRLDVQTSTPGLEFEGAWQRRVTMNYKGQSLEVVSLPDLIASKRASGRDVDLDDVRILTSSDVISTPED
jgi:hypothetical protein